MREFEDKVDPFFVSVYFPCGSIEESIRPGKSLVENRDEIVFEHDFEFDVLVILPVKGFEQGPGVGPSGEGRQLMPAV